MNYIKRFFVEPGVRVNLNEVDAGFKDKHESYEHALPEIEAYNQKLHDLQYLMYAEGKRSLLICLQGRDAAGKDGTINHEIMITEVARGRITALSVRWRGRVTIATNRSSLAPGLYDARPRVQSCALDPRAHSPADTKAEKRR